MPSLQRSIEQPIDLVLIGSIPSCSSAEMDTRVQKAHAATRRGIIFNEDVYVQETHHINDFSDDEVFHYWFDKRDYQQMKIDFAPTVRLLSIRQLPVDSDEHCGRGLEYRTREGAQRRKLNKLTALCAVLDEQERQRLEGELSDHKLSKVYIRASASCRQMSHLMALQDEEDVHGVLLIEAGGDDSDEGRLSDHIRSRNAGTASRPESHEEIPRYTRSTSHDSPKSNRIRGFFNRHKDKPELTGATSP